MHFARIFLRRFVSLVAVPLAFAAVGARAQMVGGVIAGTVVDPANAAVEQARVILRNDETGSERRLATGEDGHFSAASLPIGVYTVTVTHDGFAPLTQTGVAIAVGQQVQLRQFRDLFGQKVRAIRNRIVVQHGFQLRCFQHGSNMRLHFAPVASIDVGRQDHQPRCACLRGALGDAHRL